MTAAGYWVVVGLCLIGLGIRTGYELLKQANRVDTRSKLIFAIVFLGMILMLLSWPLMSSWDPRSIVPPAGIHWAGLIILVAGLGLALGGLIQLRGLENIDHLVATGLFARLRHPMYTGFILWILGWVIFNGAVTSLGVGLVAIACILYWRALEEQNLAAQFGEDYIRYKKATWF